MLTETQIERAVERMFDALDAELMAAKIDQTIYDIRAEAISQYAEEALKQRRALDARPHIFDEPEYSRFPLISPLHDPDTLEVYP